VAWPAYATVPRARLRMGDTLDPDYSRQVKPAWTAIAPYYRRTRA